MKSFVVLAICVLLFFASGCSTTDSGSRRNAPNEVSSIDPRASVDEPTPAPSSEGLQAGRETLELSGLEGKPWTDGGVDSIELIYPESRDGWIKDEPDPNSVGVNGPRKFLIGGANYINGDGQDWDVPTVDGNGSRFVTLKPNTGKKKTDYVANWFYWAGGEQMAGNQWEQDLLDYAFKIGLRIDGDEYQVVLGNKKLNNTHNWFIGGKDLIHVWEPAELSGSDGRARRAVYTPDRKYVVTIEDGVRMTIRRSPIKDSAVLIDTENWMSKLSNKDRTLSELIIPGTHDAMTAGITTNGQRARFNQAECFGPRVAKSPDIVAWANAPCATRAGAIAQDQQPRQQLDDGIRYFDVRISTPINYCESQAGRGDLIDQSCIVAHHTFESMQLKTALEQIKSWVDSHPQEQVILRFQMEGLEKNDEVKRFHEQVALATARLASKPGTNLCESAWRQQDFGSPGDLARNVTLEQAQQAGKSVLLYIEGDLTELNKLTDGCFQADENVSTIWPEGVRTDTDKILRANTGFLENRKRCIEDPSSSNVKTDFQYDGKPGTVWDPRSGTEGFPCEHSRGLFVSQNQKTPPDVNLTDSQAKCALAGLADNKKWYRCDLRITGNYNNRIMDQVKEWKTQRLPTNIQMVNLYQAGLTENGTLPQTLIALNE